MDFKIGIKSNQLTISQTFYLAFLDYFWLYNTNLIVVQFMI